MINPRVKTTDSSSTVTFRNTSGSYYDMIISVQNKTVNQTITIQDTEGNLITENDIVLLIPAKVILKDVQLGSITFDDSNSYNITISYVVKESATGIPYIDLDYQNGYTYTQNIETPTVYGSVVTASTVISLSPPPGTKWLIHSILMYWEAGATQTDIVAGQIVPQTGSGIAQPYLQASDLFAYESLSVTANDLYVVSLGEFLQSLTGKSITIGTDTYNVNQYVIPKAFYLSDNETLNVSIASESSKAQFYVQYTEVSTG